MNKHDENSCCYVAVLWQIFNLRGKNLNGKLKNFPSLSKSYREEIMILEDIILHANIHIWRNPRGEFFLNISRDGGLTASECSSPENQNLHLFLCLLHYTSKLHEFQWRLHCCCHYAVTLKHLKVSLQKLKRINWADRMTVCAPGKWIVYFFTVQCLIPQASKVVCRYKCIHLHSYLEEMNNCSSYLLLLMKS